ncbi:hypothetical protein MS3_00003091 [Schistosoma haematobium]|uniref:WD repeat-containing protein 60 n=2 Tax=Schistosoma haematobium TaxID=6185 RepID=A0A922LNH5_SCHHA|nr:hypothetical protein MS3_00003091 [Schistosoma haematobium]KAH9590387.1 hypothetical protein MS3_00003091 [Schistosoma haematobium]CAH8655935.1 unnamed protein product [Schistosoma haematobium]
MSQQSGYYKSKSQVKNSFDLKPKRTYQKIQRKTHSINNPPGKGQLKEQTYSKVDKHHNGYQLTQNINPIQKSEENLVKDNKVSKIFSSESSPVPDVSYLRNSVSFNSQSNRNIHYAFKGSSNEVKVNHSGENGFQSNHTKTNVLSLVERKLDMEKRFVDDQNYKLKESGGVCLDQSFTTEIHPTEESDNDYSSDFSDECSSISSFVSSKSQELLSVDRPNNHKEMTGICESVLTTRTSGFIMPVKVIGSTNDGMDMKVIDFEQSNRLPSHHYIFSNVKRRAKDLLKLVCLSLNEFTNVFELKPIDGYGFYILHSNKCKNWNHCYVQTNVDAFHREVQTEPVDISHDVWTQQPSDENGEFCGRVGSNNNSHINGSYNLSYSNDFNHVSSKTILHELAKEFCLGVNTYNTTVNDEVEHVTNTFSINEFNTPENSTSMMNPNHRLPDSLLENLQLMLNLINEETLANLSYSSKESITDQNDLQSTENDFVEIFFQLKDDCFSVESKFDRGYNDIQNKELQNTPSKNNVTTVDANEISKLQSFSYFWENYECVACDCAPQNQAVILTIHRPVRLNQEQEEIKSLFNYSRSAGEFICIWTEIGVKLLPDRLLYCPGLSETGLKGANLNCAVFSPDNDANLVIAGLHDGGLSIWDQHKYSNEIPMKSTSLSILDDVQHQSVSTGLNEFLNLPVLLPTYKTSLVEYKDSTNTCKLQSLVNCVTQQHNHFSPIISVKIAVGDHHRYRELVDESTTDIDKFQVLALDEIGNISLWLVLMNQKYRVQNTIESLAGSQIDYCLFPGTSRLRIIRLLFIEYKSTQINIPPSLTENSLKFQTEKNNWNLSNRLNNKVITTCLAITKHGNFLIGCSNGQIIHRGRTPNQTVYPKLFSRILCCSAVQTVETHPNAELHIFIAGYTDGKICLYKTNYFQPILEWDVTSAVPITNLSKIKLTKNKDDTVAPISESISKISVNRSFISIRKLIWSATRSSVFFSLDSNNQIILWDIVNIFNLANNSLLLNDTESSLKNDYPINVNLNDKKILSCQINDICISKMSCSRNINRISSSSIAPISTHSSPLFILFYPHKISIHWINSRWINESVNENTLLMKTLDNFSSIS